MKNKTLLFKGFGKGIIYSRKSQTGVVLVISLIMLLLLTLIGLSGMQSTGLEEKMSGNMRDRNLAFQAAEAALRDAEAHILNVARVNGVTGFVANCGASTANTNDDGLCYNGPAAYATPIWQVTNMTAAPSIAYGSVTGTAAFGGGQLSAQPRYIIEGLNQGADCNAITYTYCYRITVRAQGSNPNTVVWLQTVFKPPS